LRPDLPIKNKRCNKNSYSLRKKNAPGTYRDVGQSLLSHSDSLDLIHPLAVGHQQRVAYIALRIAKAMGHHPAKQADLMYASALHDIGRGLMSQGRTKQTTSGSLPICSTSPTM